MFFLTVNIGHAIYPNGVTNLFCWDYPSGNAEFEVRLVPDDYVSRDWTYGPNEIEMTARVGELAHEAIDLPMWKVDQMGGLHYAKRESKRVKRTPPMEQSKMLNIFWMNPYGDDVLFLNLLDIDYQLNVSREYAQRKFMEEDEYSIVMIFSTHLGFTRYRNNPDGKDLEISGGFCEERW